VDKRIVYAAAALMFSLGIMVDTMDNWDKPASATRLAIVSFNLIGFVMMVFYQFLNKWIVGAILVTIIALESMVPFSLAIKNYLSPLSDVHTLSSVSPPTYML
jgi:hypothetical protein